MGLHSPTTGKSKISVGRNETDKKINFILSVREKRQVNYETDRKIVNILSVSVPDRKNVNTLSVFLVHTGKYEKKSTRQNLPPIRTSGAKRKPKRTSKKEAHSSYVTQVNKK